MDINDYPQDPLRSAFVLRASGRARISDREKARVEMLLRRALALGSWDLLEACQWTMAFEANVEDAWTSPIRALRSHGLLLRAQTDARAGKLRVGNRNEAKEKWWVYPADFIQWAVESPILVGGPRSLLLRQFLKVDEISSAETIARKRVLESKSYKCSEFDIACQAISHFWLEDSQPENGDQSSDTIRRWINKNFEVDKNAYERIDALIRPNWAKKGGRKPSPR